MNLRNVDDWPSMNFIVTRNLFQKLKGFNEKYWPGEDSKFCEKIILNKKKIQYMPKLIIYHYKRSNFFKHIKQIFKYAYHRGIFFRQNDNNSKKIKYLIPSFFLSYLFFLLININNNLLGFYIPLFLFLLLNIIEIILLIKKKIYFENLIVIFLIIINQIVYGFGFIMGLTKNSFNYKLKLGR
jgi:GT2 family glycosyltransferase